MPNAATGPSRQKAGHRAGLLRGSATAAQRRPGAKKVATTLTVRGSKAAPAAPPDTEVPEGLTYSSDTAPGYSRKLKGDHFEFFDTRGKPIRDEKTIARIRKLAIPPAYTDVWICPSANGHIQATGRDARGRKQYRYHPRWREERDSGKFDRLIAFSEVLPSIRRRVEKDLKGPSHSRELVLATIVRLLDTTLVRVGNDQYAKENGSFGLTTLRNRHVKIQKGVLKLSFKGKSGVRHEVEVKDPRVLRVVKGMLNLPGQELFQWQDEDGTLHAVSSGDVNDYLHEACGERFTAKDFRTWHGTVLALESVRKFCGEEGAAFTIKALLSEVSSTLGNTPAVCRKAYIHPDVLELGTKFAQLKGEGVFDEYVPAPVGANRGLTAAEHRLVAFLSRSQTKHPLSVL